MTSVYKRVEDAVAYATSLKQPAVVRGQPGIGKTTALVDICSRDYRAAILSVSYTQTTPNRMFAAIAKELLGYGHYRDNSYADMHEYLFTRAPELAAQGRYLIIDEAQRLDLKTVMEVLGLWEFCRLPIIFCGNNEILKKSRTAEAAFDQIKSRIGKEVHVTTLERNDFVLIGMEYGVSGNDAYQALANYGMRTSMREAVRLLDFAQRLTTERAPAITLAVLQDAIQLAAGDPKAVKMLAA